MNFLKEIKALKKKNLFFQKVFIQEGDTLIKSL